MTHRDQLNNMSNEELAEKLYNIECSCHYCKYEGEDCNGYTGSCREGIIEWLNMEVEKMKNNGICLISLVITIIVIIILAGIMIFGSVETNIFINYKESNDRDLARITAVTQKQDLLKTYYEVEVEYLTNTANGVLQTKNIERDTFYFYYDNKELEKKAKDNLYQEVWITSGYKGGHEFSWTFGTKLLKDIEPKEAEE